MAQKYWLPCSGDVHIKDKTWNVSQFTTYLRDQCLSWREIYYKLWAHFVTLNCEDCRRNFIGAEIGQCIYHSQLPDRTEYPCCGMLKFVPGSMRKGCNSKNHSLAIEWSSAENQKLYNDLIKRYHIIAEPYIDEDHYEEQYEILESQITDFGRMTQPESKDIIDSIPLYKIKDSPPLNVLLHMYTASKESTENKNSNDGEKTPNKSSGNKKSKKSKMGHKKKGNG